MEPIILDGKKLSIELNDQLSKKIETKSAKYDRSPGLATILVGNDPASQVYVNMKHKACKKIGIHSFQHQLPETTLIQEIYALINQLNADPLIDGILVQMPFPKYLRKYESVVMEKINPQKDVDGFHPQSIGNNTFGDEVFASCTPKGMIRLLEEYDIEIDGKEVVIVNRTNVIGKPLAMMFLNRSATITVCHSHTKDLDFHLQRADIIAVGVGKVNFVTKDRIKKGVVILDAGINRNSKGKLVGDVDFNDVLDKCHAITPVPGGLGPMTIAMLLENTYLAFLKHNS